MTKEYTRKRIKLLNKKQKQTLCMQHRETYTRTHSNEGGMQKGVPGVLGSNWPGSSALDDPGEQDYPPGMSS